MFQVGSLCTGRAGACVVHLKNSWLLEPHLVLPGCTESEYQLLLIHGWFTSKCPCEAAIPLTPRVKTYRTTATSTEPCHAHHSSSCMSCQAAVLRINPPPRLAAAAISHTYEEIGAVGGGDKGVATGTECARTTTTTTVVVASTALDFYQIREKSEEEMHSRLQLERFATNINPGYKSTTPPDDMTLPYPRIPPVEKEPGLAVVQENVECGGSLATPATPPAPVSRSVSQLHELMQSSDWKPSNPRASWCAPSTRKSPSPPYAHVKSMSSPGGFLHSPPHSPKSPRERSSSPHTSAHLEDQHSAPHSPKDSSSSQKKGKSRIPTPPRSPRGSWVFPSPSNRESSNSPYYWELEVPSHIPPTANPKPAVPPKSSKLVSSFRVISKKDKRKKDAKALSVSTPQLSTKNSHSPQLTPRAAVTGKSQVDVRHSPQRSERAERGDKTEKGELPSQSMVWVPQERHHPHRGSGGKAGVGNGLKCSDKHSVGARSDHPRMGTAKCTPGGRHHRGQHLDTGQGEARSTPPASAESTPMICRARPTADILTKAAAVIDQVSSRQSRRSQSCEQLVSAPKDTRRSKRRCPTPPRVLSPSMENVTCEVIADIWQPQPLLSSSAAAAHRRGSDPSCSPRWPQISLPSFTSLIFVCLSPAYQPDTTIWLYIHKSNCSVLQGAVTWSCGSRNEIYAVQIGIFQFKLYVCD